MNGIIIRTAETSDYEGAEKIVEQVQALHVEWRPDIYKECEPALLKEEFEALAESKNFIVAEENGKIIGILNFVERHINSNTQVERKVLFIDTLAVEEEHRGRGTGRLLLDYAKNVAAERKLDGVELQVNARNTAARKFYESCGFTEKSINMELL